MRLLSPLAEMRDWRGRFRPRPVVLSVPHPAGECLRRLALATAPHGSSTWYLDPVTLSGPRPRLRGDATPSRVRVTRWRNKRSRISLTAWLDARLDPTGEGGTVLRGTIGPPGEARAARLAGLVLASVLGLAIAGIGVGGLAIGQLLGLVAVAAGPLFVAFFIQSFIRDLARLEFGTEELIWQVNKLLDSTVVFAGRRSPGSLPGP
jgi:hypothetical protein